jgi:hypothetical protein
MFKTTIDDQPVRGFDSLQFVQEAMMLHVRSGRVCDGETAGGFPIMALFAPGDVADGRVRAGAVPELVVPASPLFVRGAA